MTIDRGNQVRVNYPRNSWHRRPVRQLPSPDSGQRNTNETKQRHPKLGEGNQTKEPQKQM